MNKQELKMFVEAEFNKLKGSNQHRTVKHNVVLKAIRDMNPAVYDLHIRGDVHARVINGAAICDGNTVNYFVDNFYRSRWSGAMSSCKHLGDFVRAKTIDNVLYRYQIGTKSWKLVTNLSESPAETFTHGFNSNLRRILNMAIRTLANSSRCKYQVSNNPKDVRPGTSAVFTEVVDVNTVRIHIKTRWTSRCYPLQALRDQVISAIQHMDVVSGYKINTALQESVCYELKLDSSMIKPNPSLAAGNLMDTDVAHAYLTPIKALELQPTDHVGIAKNSISIEMKSVKAFIDTTEAELYKQEIFVAELKAKLEQYQDRLKNLKTAMDLL